MTGDPEGEFDGAKTILLLGGRLAVIRRDDIDGIAYPGRLDLPGGGREWGETPVACALRELHEELGLWLRPDELSWRRFYTIPTRAWFFAAALPGTQAAEVRFGNEGQGWFLMPPEDFAASGEAVPHFRPRVLEGVAALRM
ncbi:hypothetical protein A3731_23870 [Roseovarius sp. HI0049]|nr:hypothetical protein A3731_23870 [Roseovarius sp. HI0049]